MNLMNEALDLFARLGAKDAIIQGNGQKISFVDFSNRLHQVCNELEKQGLKKGDKILLLCPVEIDLYLLIGAIFKMGAIVVFVDPWASKEYIKRSLEKVSPDFVIYSKKAMPLIYSIGSIRKISNKLIKETIFQKSLKNAVESGKCEDVLKDHSALLTFTTGSTSSPKCFDRTHEFLLAQKKAHYDNFLHGNGPDLCMFPVFVLSNLANGITSVLADIDLKSIKNASGEHLFNQIKSTHVSSLTCSPALVKVLLSYCLDNKLTLPQLEFFYTGGAPINPLLFDELYQIFPKAKLMLVYGSTEAEPIAMMEGTQLLEKTKALTLKGKGTVLGEVVDGLLYKLIKPSKAPLDNYEEVLDGEIGEIILSGDFVGKRYYKSEIDFKKNKIVEQDKVWHRTGDHGVLREGIVYMMGRDNNQVLEGQRVIYPLEVEPILDALNFVERTCFFQYDEVLKLSGLLIQLKKGINYSSIVNELKSKLKEININPDQIHFVAQMPVDPRHNSKVDITQVKRVFSKEAIDEIKTKNIISKFLMYCSERFPLVASILFVSLFSFDAFYLTQLTLSESFTGFSIKMLVACVVMFLTFFHLRLMDEFKDFDEDRIAYPERVLSRGIITLKHFKVILSIMFSLEFFGSLYLGISSFLAWSGVFVYSILMYKEFFVHDYLKSRLTLYLITHQLILPLMVLFLSISVTNFATINTTYIYALIYIASLSFYYEVSRKTWSFEMEKEGADSYTKVWGIKKTSLVLLSSLALMVFLSSQIVFGLNLSRITFFVFLVLVGLCAFLIIRFMKGPNTKAAKMVGHSGAIVLIGFHLIMILNILISIS